MPYGPSAGINGIVDFPDNLRYLSSHLANAVDSRIAGKNPATDIQLYSVMVHTDVGPFVRNPTFWAQDLVQGFTCASPSNSSGANLGAGTMITPRHFVTQFHSAPFSVGTTMRFVTAADVVVLGTTVADVQIGAVDMRMYVLNADLPGTIIPCKVLPDDLSTFLKIPAPLIVLDQDEHGLIFNASRFGVRGPSFVFYDKPINDAQRLAFWEALINNDSGNPSFFFVNGEVVLVGTTSTSGTGTTTAGINAALNAAIVAVDTLAGAPTGYTVTPASLTNFLEQN